MIRRSVLAKFHSNFYHFPLNYTNSGLKCWLWHRSRDQPLSFFLNRTVDATLSGALLAITSDRSKLSDHYERDSPILSEASVERIVAGARCLDEMDAEGLAELQIAAFVSSGLVSWYCIGGWALKPLQCFSPRWQKHTKT